MYLQNVISFLKTPADFGMSAQKRNETCDRIEKERSRSFRNPGAKEQHVI